MKILTRDLTKKPFEHAEIQIIANLPNGDVKVYNIVDLVEDPDSNLVTITVDGHEIVKAN